MSDSVLRDRELQDLRLTSRIGLLVKVGPQSTDTLSEKNDITCKCRR